MMSFPIGYAILQVLALGLLRKVFLMTVYQTAAAYGAVCVVGILLTVAADREKGLDKWKLASLRDCYLMAWSGIHGVIVLGFLSNGSYYLTLTQVTLVQLVNLFLGVVVYWIFYIITNRAVISVGLGNLFIGILGTVNFYLMRFRGAPFQWSDLKAAATAKNVVTNYDFTPNVLLIGSLADLLLWYLLWRQYLAPGRSNTPKESNARKGHFALRRQITLWKVLGTIVVLGGCIALPVMGFDQVYAENMQFSQDTHLADLLAEAMGSTQSLPEDYSVERAQQIRESWEQENNENATQSDMLSKPNIVVVMNEAFSDLRVLGDLETTEPVLPFWDSLKDSCIHGWANVSVLGGTTANSEYEFLTSDAVGLYPNTIPYNKYFSSEDSYPGLVSALKAQGYETTAFHPYLASGWNRTQVYRAMQFDHIIFQEDLEEKLDTLRIYTSDRGDYSVIMDRFEQKDTGIPQFLFNVTMQNHGGYTYTGDNFQTTVQLKGQMQGQFPQTEQYLSLMKASDEALQELIAYFETYPEPVILVLYGDHQPRLEDGFYEYVTGQPIGAWDLEKRMNQHKTPFIIWKNYETESKDLGDVSVNYLASLLLQEAALPMTDYQQYVLENYQKLPVITALGIKDVNGNIFAKGSAEYAQCTDDYRMLIYNHTADREGRMMGFY